MKILARHQVLLLHEHLIRETGGAHAMLTPLALNGIEISCAQKELPDSSWMWLPGKPAVMDCSAGCWSIRSERKRTV